LFLLIVILSAFYTLDSRLRVIKMLPMGRNSEARCLRKRKDTGYWFYKLKGWKDYTSTGTKVKSEAMAVVNEALRKESLNLPEEGREAFEVPTLKKYAAFFYVYDQCPHIQRIGMRITKESAKINRINVDTHILPDLIAKMRLDMIKVRDITDFRTRLPAKKVRSKAKKANTEKIKTLSPATVNKVMNVLNVILNEAVINGDIPKNPCKSVSVLKEGSGRRGVFQLDEIFQLLEWKNCTTQYFSVQ
jgi:hypothetical protein